MKNILLLCFAAFMSQGAFAQQTAAPASCTSNGITETTATPASDASAQTTGMVKKTGKPVGNSTTAQFQVSGNCGMCKKTIEKAAKGVAGVTTADWNVETHQFSVAFDPAKISVDKVHKAIAAAGYDTDRVRGDDLAYSKLHGCCQYERLK